MCVDRMRWRFNVYALHAGVPEHGDRCRRGFGRADEGLRLLILGLEGFEGAERAPELGLCGAAVAQQRGEGAPTVAIADEREAEVVAVAEPLLLEDLRLDAIGAQKPPGGRGDAPGEMGLQSPLGRKLGEECFLVRLVLGRILVRQDDVALGAKPVLQRILRRARLAGFGPRPARLSTIEAARLCPCAQAGEGHALCGSARALHGGAPCWQW
jgi:hypothetical protein